jgi:GH15 family glucan-1,4-alpha-glucosidase
MTPLPIEDYAVIGDCETAALVGRDGSIDWLCLPRFDYPACFAALLGTEANGRWRLAPAGAVTRVRRAYRDDTLVLETEFETGTGVVAVVDFMPPRVPEVVRVVEGPAGPRGDEHGAGHPLRLRSLVPWVRRTGDGLAAVGGSNGVLLLTPVPLRNENFQTFADFTVTAGEQVPFRLAWFPSHQPPPPSQDAAQSLKETESWWRGWASRCTYEGVWRGAVVRSLVTLKALAYEPTGGIVAAVTTSLPEQPGGTRNWDYRYCWLRDATFTLCALMIGGYLDEARSWRDWLVRAVAGRPAQAQILYGVGGERLQPEWTLPWLKGYEGATPVRVGNAATTQFQLDVYGEVLDALHVARRAGLASERERLACRARLRRLRHDRVAGARRGDLGSARRPSALHPLQGDGLDRPRPRRARDRAVRAAGAAQPLALDARGDPRGCVPSRLRSRGGRLRAVLR